MAVDSRLIHTARLLDGAFRSGREIGAQLGLSRAGVSKRLAALRRAGLPIESRRGCGYRLSLSPQWLDADWLRSRAAALQIELEVVASIDSTNAELLRRSAVDRLALLAEYQSVGRGRRGRRWVAPPGAAVLASLQRLSGRPMQQLGAFSLVAGVGVHRALLRLGVPTKLKWPNDVLLRGRKLAGVLIEADGEAEGPVRIVTGIGINHQLFGAEPVDAASVGPAIDRNELAIAVLEELDRAIESFFADGFACVAHEFHAADALRDRWLRIDRGTDEVRGVGAGVDAEGRLLLRDGDHLHRLTTGSIIEYAAD